MRKLFFVFTALLLFHSADLLAQQDPNDATGGKIIAVEVIGNRIISTQTVISKMKSQPGAPLTQRLINEDIRRLFKTGFFDDIEMNVAEFAEGYKLIVEVVEKPVIRTITVSGNTVFKEEKIRKNLGIIEGQILDEQAIKNGVEEIRKLYANKGFRFIDIKSDVSANEDKEITVTITIMEGKKYRIKDVTFSGNESFSEKTLKKLMKTKERKWFFFGTFKEEEFQQDIERVYFYYQKEGFIDVEITPEFEYDKENEKIFINVAVKEGKQYLTGDVQFQGNELFPDSEIWFHLDMLPGLTYSQFYLAEDLEAIRSFYAEEGYIEARVIPDVQLNSDTGKVDVLYEIVEGDLYFVDKVIVRGNTKTKDTVIRRELRIYPGERFDGEKIKKSKQRLENLGYFEETTYDIEPSDSGDNRKDLVFRVKEKRTGELSFGGGVSSVDKFVGFAEISQKNFDLFNWPRLTGGGQSVSLRARLGTISQNFAFSFVEPYLFGTPYSMGLDIYNTQRDNENVDFEENRLGAGITISKLIKDKYRLGGAYKLERVKLDEIPSNAPATVKLFEGKTNLSRFRVFGQYDTRDSVFAPTRGTQAGVSAELVGTVLGGDEDYYIFKADYSRFFSFFEKHVLEIGLHAGVSSDLGSSTEVPIFDRFYAGGLGSVRGYNYRRVGPLENDNAVGGQTMATLNIDYTFPIPKLESFRGVVFLDAGQVNPDSYKLDGGDFAVSVGPGIKVKTPLGPVALYYGLPIANKDTEDENGRFEFSLSRGF